MTNDERVKRRIARDKERREIQKWHKQCSIGDVGDIFTTPNMYDSLAKCRKGTDWKNGVQCYLYHNMGKIEIEKQEIIAGTYKFGEKASTFIIYERGKRREIKAVKIDDRVAQRTLCDYALVPMIYPSLIYDNPASVKDKGIQFARDRMKDMLRNYIVNYGTDGYALVFDFKNFFGSIRHDICKETLEKFFDDENIVKIVMDIVTSYERGDIKKIKNKSERLTKLQKLDNYKEVGITLGSQVSQILALVVPNIIDHHVKDNQKVKYYIRYMDDGIILSNDKKVLWEVLNEINELATALGLTLNMKKTNIFKIRNGFTFLKIKYKVTETGKIVRCLTRSSIVRMRRKLKKYRRLVDEGKMSLDDVYVSFRCWYGNAKKYANSYHARKSMLKLYNSLFDSYRTEYMKVD